MQKVKSPLPFAMATIALELPRAATARVPAKEVTATLKTSGMYVGQKDGKKRIKTHLEIINRSVRDLNKRKKETVEGI